MYATLTERFADKRPLKPASSPLLFKNKNRSIDKKGGDRKAGSERGVQWERKQVKSHIQWL